MIKVEKRNDDYVCELWGASTKHPDSIFFMLGDQEREQHYIMSTILTTDEQVYQWLLWVASTLTFPFYARELVVYANEHWYPWD